MTGAGVRLGKKTVSRYNSLYRDKGGLMTGVSRVAIHGVYCDIKRVGSWDFVSQYISCIVTKKGG